VHAVIDVTRDVEREQLYAGMHVRITMRGGVAVTWLALR